MEETASPSSLPQSSDPSPSALISLLEKHVIASMDSLVDNLQSLHQEGALNQEILKGGIHQVSRLAQASLLIRTLPSLLAPLDVKGDDVQRKSLFKKIHQTVETLQTLCKDQTMQAIDLREAEILKQIKAKEQQIREQIAQKQQAIAKLVRSQTQAR